MTLRFNIVNLGCKVNRVESDSFSSALSDMGLVETDLECADLVIVNTCTVTGEAEKKTRKSVRHALRSNRLSRIVVTGCSSAIDPSLYSSMDPRIEVVGKADVLDYLRSIVDDLACNESDHIDDAFSIGCDWPHFRSSKRSRRGMKIQDGCDNSCSYCIVCKARGSSRSKDPERVLEEFTSLIDDGINEIILTGINIGAYFACGLSLVDLLARMIRIAEERSAVEKRVRIRLSSIEPSDITDQLIDLLSESDGAICRHLHIPMQSGSSKVLREMKRGYSAEDFERLISKLRDNVERISITTDVIVGFPGESDEDFEETCKLCRKCGFSKIHVFPYSMRAGTEAAVRMDQVDPMVKSERARKLREISSTLRREDALSRMGTEELYLVQEDGRMMSESYYETAADPSFPVGELVLCGFKAID